MPKKRTTRRRRRRGGLVRLLRPLSVLLAAVAVVAALTLFFKVDKIETAGSARYQAEEIIAASGVERGDNLILLDRRRIAQRLYTELPYITQVQVTPQFPDTLLLEITETRAIASIQGAGGYWLLSAKGKLVEAAEESAAADYLAISGVEALSPAVSHMLELPEESPISRERLAALLEALESRGMMARVDGLDVSDEEILVLGYDGRFQVEMFYDADFDFKLHCLQEAVELLEPNERGVLRMTMQDDNEARFIPAPQPAGAAGSSS
ncbi:MAG: FtsQ-type POTRA domain-containing protein [Oscillospiraceae bacterium]|jgi:cell division protein FtsQ|nr:FtsQ-type POTRA domain-containing protein [Oscillospiraceae bacterium]MCI9391095.1 FtsQ-type POTRA domain-containing protein [Oscillospiraceae bacterium]